MPPQDVTSVIGLHLYGPASWDTWVWPSAESQSEAFYWTFLSLGALSSCLVDFLLILILFHFGFLWFASLYKHAFVLEISLRKYVNDGQCIK